MLWVYVYTCICVCTGWFLRFAKGALCLNQYKFQTAAAHINDLFHSKGIIPMGSKIIYPSAGEKSLHNWYIPVVQFTPMNVWTCLLLM